MKKLLLIGITTCVVMAAVLFAVNSEANAYAKNGNALAIYIFQENKVVLPPVEEEGSIFTNPFYIAAAIFTLALGLEIYLVKRKRDREKMESDKSKAVLQAEPAEKKVKKRYSKEEMSEILKASAGKKPTHVARESAAANNTETTQDAAHQETHAQQKIVWELREPRTVEELKIDDNDDTYYDALVDVEDEEAMIRAVAARVLARHKTINAVKGLTKMTLEDSNVEVRLESIDALKQIGHVSVFTPLMIAASDENQSIKQAAIQAITSLSFNMADNYVRLIKTADDETLKKVARACLVTGLVHKAFRQLHSQQPEQAYEGFALLSLLAKAGETKPLMDAITKHPDMEMRVLAIKIMNDAHRNEAQEQLLGLSQQENIPPYIRESLLNTVRQSATAN